MQNPFNKDKDYDSWLIWEEKYPPEEAEVYHTSEGKKHYKSEERIFRNQRGFCHLKSA